jgi:F-type H+-transporting ATPase subunit a
MNKRKQILIGLGVVYLLGLIALGIAFGSHGKLGSCDEAKPGEECFSPQNEFKLLKWAKIGPIEINKGVMYIIIAGILTTVTMLWIARRMQARPNRVQTAVETIYTWMRDGITGANMDDSMAAKWFPFVGALFLFIWYSNLIGYIPLPTNSGEKFNLFGVHLPAFALYAATANLALPLVLALIVFIAFNVEGIRAKGPIGYVKSLIPGGVKGAMLLLIFPLELMSTFMRLISLTVRLWANLLAGHLIILFMSGGLAVLLGLSAIGWLTLPLGILLFLFEVGLVATLQAFIFATLSAIYLGGAVAEGH